MSGTRSRAAMRHAVGSLVNESNSFSPLHADRDYFLKNGHLLSGEEVLPYHVGRKNELSGLVAGARERDVELQPLCAAWAVPYGNLEGRFHEQIKRESIARYRHTGPPDGLHLSLHGSMGVEGIDDPEGDLIEAMKEVHPHTPITITLDFHADVARRMMENADILIGHNSFPHTNMHEMGLKAAEAAIERFDRIEGMRRPFLKPPLVAPLEPMTVVGDEPMDRLVKVIEEVELHEGVVDPEHFRCVGLHPERMKMVPVKSQGSYKAAYERISRRVIHIETPGLARGNVFEVPYRRIDKRGLYPFNRNANFDPRRDMVTYENNLS
jgi:microcystin degradation protein MlrC